LDQVNKRERDDASVVLLIPALKAFARTLSRNPTDADDLVQETLLRTLKSFDSFEPDTRLKSWMFTIMRNTFITRAKVAAREAPGLAECVANSASVQANQEFSSSVRDVQKAIDQLPPHYREVLFLIGVSGVSYDETAKICECTIGTVKSRLNRARTHVLQELGERLADDPESGRGN
jgi:RNA polymerase sigma factor (sigma-70 family)